jgi:hypothetical protein
VVVVDGLIIALPPGNAQVFIVVVVVVVGDVPTTAVPEGNVQLIIPAVVVVVVVGVAVVVVVVVPDLIADPVGSTQPSAIGTAATNVMLHPEFNPE